MGKHHIEKFNGEHYEIWKVAIKDALLRADLDHTLVPKTAAKNQEEFDRDCKKATAILREALVSEQFSKVRACVTPVQVFAILDREYTAQTFMHRQAFYKAIMNSKLPEGGDVPKHIHHFDDLIAKAKDAGANMDHEFVIASFIYSFPDYLQNVIVTYGRNLQGENTSISLDQAKKLVLAEDLRIRQNIEFTTSSSPFVPPSSALKAKQQVKCTFCHKTGHTEDVCYSKHGRLNKDSKKSKPKHQSKDKTPHCEFLGQV